MSTLLASIANTKLKVRWQEPYVSEGLNKALSAIGKGIIHGFALQVQSAQIVRLAKNTLMDQSCAAFYDSAQGLVVMYVEQNNLDADLASFAGTTVILGLTVSYTIGAGTTGEIRAYTEGEYAAAPFGALWFGKIVVPSGVTPIADADILLWPRDELWVWKQDAASLSWGEAVADPLFFSDTKWLASATSGNCIAEVQSAVVNRGPQALRCELSGGAVPGSAYRILRSVIRAEEGDSLLVRFWARAATLTATQRGVKIDWYTSGFVLISTSYITPAALTGTAAWAQYVDTVKAPATSRYAVVSVGVNTLSVGTMYLDSLLVGSDRANRWEQGELPHAAFVNTDGVHVRNLKSVLNQMEIGWNDTTATEFEFVPTANGTYTLQIGRASKFVNVDIRGTLNVQQAASFDDAVEVIGDITKTGDLVFATPKTRKIRYTFGENPLGGSEVQWNGAAAAIAARGDWIVKQLLPVSGGIGGTDTGSIRLHGIPKGVTITDIALGVDNDADGSFGFDVELRGYDLDATGTTLLDSDSGLARTGATSIRRVDWPLGTPYTPTADQEVLVLMFRNGGSVDHFVFWVLVEYTLTTLDQELDG